MTKWTKSSSIILIGIILLALALYGIGYLLIINPLKNELDTVEQQVNMFENYYESSKNQTEDSEYNEELSTILKEVPNEKSLDNVLLHLQQMASNSNVTITHISSSGENTVTTEEGENMINGSSYSVDITGENLNTINSFLDNILESERLMIIEDLSIYQTEASAELSLTVTTFYSNG